MKKDSSSFKMYFRINEDLWCRKLKSRKIFGQIFGYPTAFLGYSAVSQHFKNITQQWVCTSITLLSISQHFVFDESGLTVMTQHFILMTHFRQNTSAKNRNNLCSRNFQRFRMPKGIENKFEPEFFTFIYLEISWPPNS